MTILEIVYASAPTDQVLMPTLEIPVPGQTPIRLCADYSDHVFGVDGVPQLFEGTSIEIALPARNTTGQQTLTFGVASVNGRIQRLIDDAMAAGEEVPLIFRNYLMSDTSAPAEAPLHMIISGGQLVGGQAQFQASYYDLLNTAWPRERYTSETAPGLKYL